jgi:hypothetical protein
VGATYARSHTYVFDKASLLAGGSGSFTRFTLPGSEGGGQVPAVGFPSNAKTMYLLQSWVGNWFGTRFLRLWRLREESGPKSGLSRNTCGSAALQRTVQIVILNTAGVRISLIPLRRS